MGERRAVNEFRSDGVGVGMDMDGGVQVAVAEAALQSCGGFSSGGFASGLSSLGWLCSICRCRFEIEVAKRMNRIMPKVKPSSPPMAEQVGRADCRWRSIAAPMAPNTIVMKANSKPAPDRRIQTGDRPLAVPGAPLVGCCRWSGRSGDRSCCGIVHLCSVFSSPADYLSVVRSLPHRIETSLDRGPAESASPRDAARV